ncbi:glycosyltransferase, partial [Camelimonas abortus]
MAGEAPVPVAFYAPMKPPDHPQPSGDRTVARALWAALRAAGYAPQLASRLRAHEKAGDAAAQRAIRAAAQAEAERLTGRWRAAPAPERPALWFTYHLYDRAPDWIGPQVAAALGIPYVAAEASLAPGRAAGPWRDGHAAVVAALRQAAAVFVLNENDRPCLLSAPELADVDMAGKCVSLPPFLARIPAAPARPPRPEGPLRLLAVAMLRHGDKLRSLATLAAALARLPRHDWRLTVVGDGPARAEAAALFAPFGARAAMPGAVNDPAELDAVYAAHDLFVWPACNEAFGMALLEAQASALPVLAGAWGGVPGVVAEGDGGWLAAADEALARHDPQAADARLAETFACRLGELIAAERRAPGFLAAAGQAGRARVLR